MLLVDHTFVYTGAVRKMGELIESGELGEIYYYDSIRVNLGLFQRDVNVISDLAVHDLSILDYLLGEHPVAVSASGTNHFPGTPENLAYITLFYDSGTIAHVNVNWLAPVKVRQILVGGSKKMIVYDDLEPSEKIKIYDKGVSFTDDPAQIQEMRVGYRTGDMWAPKLAGTEALRVEGAHFVDCIVNSKTPETDGQLGLRVVETLEAATSVACARKGETVDLQRQGEGIVIPFVDLKAQYAVDQARGRRRHPGRARQLPVHARQRGRGLREGVRGLLRRRAGHRREHRHERAAPGAAGRRRRRRVTRSSPCRSPSSRRWRRSATPAPRPVFVDIDPRTFTMDPSSSRRRSPRAPRRSSRCTCTASRPTWTRSSRSPGATAWS